MNNTNQNLIPATLLEFLYYRILENVQGSQVSEVTLCILSQVCVCRMTIKYETQGELHI